MPTDPVTLPQTTDDLGKLGMEIVYDGLQKRHWWHVNAVSSDTTVDDDTEFLLVTATASGGVGVNLPDAATAAGQSVIIGSATVASGQTITITPSSGDTVNDTSSLTITVTGKFVHLISDGTSNWILYVDGR